MSKRKSFPLRIDPKLYEVLEKWAEDEIRSVNAQIEVILKDKIKQTSKVSSLDLLVPKAHAAIFKEWKEWKER